MPSVVRQRNRKGLAGIGGMAKHLTSSAWMEAMIPRARLQLDRGLAGREQLAEQRVPIDLDLDGQMVEVKVSARIDAVSDRTLSAGARSFSES